MRRPVRRQCLESEGEFVSSKDPHGAGAFFLCVSVGVSGVDQARECRNAG